MGGVAMLIIQMLGSLHITLDGRSVNGFISSKAQALFCYLVLNHTQPPLRSALAALFWGEMPDDDASTNLRQAIANLKKLFEPYFDISRQSVAFRSDQSYALDVEQFEKSGDPQLYRGELMAGFSVPDAPEFEHWLTIERERLHHLALTQMLRQAAAHMDAGELDQSIPLLARLVALDPLHEEGQRTLMRALTMNGQRNAALAQYDACAAALRHELNIEPEAATTRLYERIRSAHRFDHLPPEITPLIGRETELAELTHRLSNANCHLITLAGFGGMGKTRLALRLAHQHVARMLHGVVMVDLTPITTTEGFFSALADALRLKLSPDFSPRRQLLDMLREQELLLILDNYEQLVGNADNFLSELLHTAPDLKVLVTSRQRLNLHSEWVLVLDGLPLQGDSSALTLFWDTARRVRGDALLTGQSASTVRRICQIVGGMPLAIELVAAWTRLLTCEELAEEIANNLTVLETTQGDVEPRHRSLQAVFDHSWQLLSGRDRQVLLGLSVFAAGFTREATEQVAGASLPVLMGMADRMLIRRTDDQRFAMHEMIRQFLTEKRKQSPEAAAIESTYIQYFVKFMQQRETMLKTALQDRAVSEISAEIDNVHGAWAMALNQSTPAALLTMMTGLSMYHDLTATWMVGEAIFHSGESACANSSIVVYGQWLSLWHC
jgi:predicted ATPase/DNA-binding SARP family transcriptional activator